MSSGVSGYTQRRANRERVIAALRRQGAMTRAALADVGLARSTVQSVIEELAEAGMVIEIGPDQASGIGRPPILVGLRGSLGVTVGVEIANWTIRVVVCDLAQEPLLHTSTPTDERADPVTTLIRASAQIDEALARTGFRRDQVLGVGRAGVPAHPGWVTKANMEATVVKDGFDTAKAICAIAGASACSAAGIS